MNSLVRLVLPDVKDLLREASPEEIAKALLPFHSADIADLIEELGDGEARTLLLGLDPEKRVETFEQLEVPQQVRLVQKIGPEDMALIVSAMAPDDRADFMSALPPELESLLLTRLPADEAKDVALLVRHEDDTAGGIMTTEFVRLSPELSAGEAIEEIRHQATGTETILALYALDDKERLQGVVSLTPLILSPPDTKISQIMYDNPITVSVDDDQEEVVRKLGHYDFLAIPVLDSAGRMVGIITHDDVLDVALEEAHEDAQLAGAIQPLSEPYFATGVVTLIRKRVVWLLVLFVAGLMAGGVLKGFEETLQRAVALYLFLPLIIASGGNSGSQSATLVIRGLAVGEMKPTDWWRIARRELASGLALGTVLGSFGVGVSYLLVDDWQDIAITVLLTLVTIVTVGSLLGSLLPIGLKKIGLDPAVTSSPLVAGLVDILGILIYVVVAGIFIGL